MKKLLVILTLGSISAVYAQTDYRESLEKAIQEFKVAEVTRLLEEMEEEKQDIKTILNEGQRHLPTVENPIGSYDPAIFSYALEGAQISKSHTQSYNKMKSIIKMLIEKGANLDKKHNPSGREWPISERTFIKDYLADEELLGYIPKNASE